MRRTVRVIESVSKWSGMIVSCFFLFLMLILVAEVFMRFALNRPTMYSYALATMLGIVIGAGGLAYTHLHHGHVRVDVLWKLLSPRGKAIADIIGSFIMFFPLLFVLLYASVDFLIFSISMHEVSMETHWYPVVWPIRTVMLIGVFLFTGQGVAKLIRDLYALKRSEL